MRQVGVRINVNMVTVVDDLRKTVSCDLVTCR